MTASTLPPDIASRPRRPKRGQRSVGPERFVEVGTRMTAEGMVGIHHGRLAILNPVYSLVPH